MKDNKDLSPITNQILRMINQSNIVAYPDDERISQLDELITNQFPDNIVQSVRRIKQIKTIHECGYDVNHSQEYDKKLDMVLTKKEVIINKELTDTSDIIRLFVSSDEITTMDDDMNTISYYSNSSLMLYIDKQNMRNVGM